MLRIIEDYRKKLPMERLVFRLERRLQSYLAVYGHLNQDLQQKVQKAWEAIKQDRPEARDLTDAAILALKEGFV
jgi:bifunctional DNase/RNase